MRFLRPRSGTMFGNSLTKANTAPSFSGPSRSRAEDISFEAGVEHESRLRAAHGRRAAQRDAYAAAATANALLVPGAPLAGSTGGRSSRHGPAWLQQQKMAVAAASGASAGSFAAAMAHKRSDAAGSQPLPLDVRPPSIPGRRGNRGAAGAPLASSCMPSEAEGDSLSIGAATLKPRSQRVPSGQARNLPHQQQASVPAAADTGGAARQQPIVVSGTATPPNSLDPSFRRNVAARGGSAGSSGMGGCEGTVLAGVGRPSEGTTMDVAGVSDGASPISSGRRREGSGQHAGSPVRMQRARTWSALVENAYRLQEVGYDPEPEADARSDASWARHPVCSP